MKIYINKTFLKNVMKNKNEYYFSEELQWDAERLKQMISNEVNICTIVTGYRGTGKTSFIRNLLSSVEEENKNVLAIHVNASTYTTYPVFLKRVIREIYLKYTEKYREAPENIRLTYLHTFYNMTDRISSGEKEENRGTKKWGVQCTFYLEKLIQMICEQGVLVTLLSYIIWGPITGCIGLLIVILAMGIGSFEFSFKGSKSKENIKQKESATFIETLYDDEIAEYHFFHALEMIRKQEKKQIVFVIDELDKIEKEEALERLFFELKPLLLSGYGNFILIAGRMMDDYLSSGIDQEDSVISSIFSSEIYIPLATVDELKVFWEHFDKTSTETDYVNSKILASKGVMRKFINEIVRDIEWEDGKPCIEILDDKESGYSGKMINIIKKFEEIFHENDDEKQRDRYLFQLYDWIDALEKKKTGTINVQEILNDLDENERGLYLELMQKLCDEKLMKCDEYKKMYHWIGTNPVANDNSELFTDDENKVISAFYDAGARAERMLQCVGTYVELPDVEIFLDELQKTEHEHMSERVYDVFSVGLKLYYKARNSEISKDDVKQMQHLADGIRGQIGRLVETMLGHVLKAKVDTSIVEVCHDSQTMLYDYSIARRGDEDSRVLVDCKYYHKYVSGIIATMRRAIVNIYDKGLLKKKNRIIYVIFTDEMKAEQKEYLKNHIYRLFDEYEISEKSSFHIVSWDVYADEIDALLKEILGYFIS